jgi:cystathionine gamma-synthase
MPDDRAPQTVAAANGIATDRTFGAVAPPLYLSSTFAFAGFGQARDYDYTRTTNPSRAMLADTIARLESGAGGVVVSSGMAAVDLVLSRLRSDDLIVAPHDCYAGTWRLLAARRDRGQFDVAFVDQGDDAALESAFNRSPALVLIETPSNPLMRIVDIRAIAARAKIAGAKVVVDNTFLSPALKGRSPLARTSSSIQPPNISMVIQTWSVAL